MITPKITIRKCSRCHKYTMKDTCPSCKEQTQEVSYKFKSVRDEER